MFPGYEHLDAGPGVYMLINHRSGERYMGQSTQLSWRAADHWQKLRDGVHENDRIQEACNRDGLDAFSICLLESVDVDEEWPKDEEMWQIQARLKSLLRKRETHYIRLFRPEYNLHPGDHWVHAARLKPTLPVGLRQAISHVADQQRQAVYRFLINAWKSGELEDFIREHELDAEFALFRMVPDRKLCQLSLDAIGAETDGEEVAPSV